MLRHSRKHLLVVLLLSLAPWCSVAFAQPVLEGTEELDFDRPEAWAMKFFSAASQLTTVAAPQDLDPGSIELGFEALSVPHLDEEQRTVGFNGVKEEDLNRSPAWARLRATVGLPAAFRLTVGWMPPVDIDGVEANLITLGLGRRLWTGDRWRLNGSLFGQTGQAKGDFTCPADNARFPVGSPDNPFGCEAPSEDEIDLDYLGIEFVTVRESSGVRMPDLHFGLAATQLDVAFQTHATTFGLLDRTRLEADGWNYSVTTGLTWQLGERTGLGVEAYYAPLSVQRPGDTDAGNDPLFNIRALLRYRVH